MQCTHSRCLWGAALKLHVQTSPALGIPLSVVYACVPVAFLDMAVFLAIDLFAAVPSALREGDREPASKEDAP